MFQSKFLNMALEHLCFKPDPGAMYIDASSFDWSDLKFYAFPSISVIPTVLSKVKQDRAEDIIVVLFWPTEVWYPAMFQSWYRLKFR